ncbi:MAG: ABC transporter permease, partial [Longimicrobiales bacterium]
ARRLGVYMTAIALGVAALVAINSFRAGVSDNVRDEARRLLGADLQLTSGRPFPDSAQSVVDSLANAGTPVSTIAATVSVALAPGGHTRLVQLRAVDGGFPFYGEYATEPAGLWRRLADSRAALVEPSVLTALDIAIGDTLRLGDVGFRIAGVLTDLPADVAFRSAVGPRVYIARRWLDDTGLIRFGSMVSYQAYLAMPDATERDAFLERYRPLLRAAQVRTETAEEQAEDIARALDTLARFLGLVGLAALLLGGLGVASAVGVFVKEKRQVIAVLRCLGATQRTAFVAYLLQAALLGFAGAAAGALLGIGLQAAIPPLLADVIPIRTTFAIHPAPIAAGLAIGVAVATLFALLPLLEIRGISPLQALRQDFAREEADHPHRLGVLRLRARTRPSSVPLSPLSDPFPVLTWTIVFLGITLIAVIQAEAVVAGVAFAAGIATSLLVLRLAASGLLGAAKRWFPRRARFEVRQGIAGLFRPRNQTAAVTVALGFGVFVVATLWLVQRSLLEWLEVDDAAEQPNLVVFDIQPAQRADVARIIAGYAGQEPELVAIVPARIVALNGTTVEALLASADSLDVERWALRHEYRNTFRARMTESEELVAGEWWSADTAEARENGAPPGSFAPRGGGAGDDAAPARISMEADL